LTNIIPENAFIPPFNAFKIQPSFILLFTLFNHVVVISRYYFILLHTDNKKYQCIEHILFIVNCSHGHWPMAIQIYGYLLILIYSFGQNKGPLVKQGAIVPTRSIQNHFWLGEGLGYWDMCITTEYGSEQPAVELNEYPWLQLWCYATKERQIL